MKKIFKLKLFYFILGAIIFGGIGTVFAYSIFANDVGFTPMASEWDVDNVEDALNSLHTELDVLYRKGYINLSSPIPSSIGDSQIISSSYNDPSKEYAYYAFDKVANSFWTSDPNETLPQYLGWDFGEKVAVYSFYITNRLNMIDTTVGEFILQGFRNGEWEDIQSYTHTERGKGATAKYIVSYPNYYYKYRTYILTEGVRNAKYIQISQLDFEYLKQNVE